VTARRLALLVLTLMAACLVAALAFSQEPEVRELEVEDVYMGSHGWPLFYPAFSFQPSAVRVTLRTRLGLECGQEKLSSESLSLVRYTAGWHFQLGEPTEDDLGSSGPGFAQVAVIFPQGGADPPQYSQPYPVLQTPWLQAAFDGEADQAGSSGASVRWRSAWKGRSFLVSGEAIANAEHVNLLHLLGSKHLPGYESFEFNGATWPSTFPTLASPVDVRVTLTAYP